MSKGILLRHGKRIISANIPLRVTTVSDAYCPVEYYTDNNGNWEIWLRNLTGNEGLTSGFRIPLMKNISNDAQTASLGSLSFQNALNAMYSANGDTGNPSMFTIYNMTLTSPRVDIWLLGGGGAGGHATQSYYSGGGGASGYSAYYEDIMLTRPDYPNSAILEAWVGAGGLGNDTGAGIHGCASVIAQTWRSGNQIDSSKNFSNIQYFANGGGHGNGGYGSGGTGAENGAAGAKNAAGNNGVSTNVNSESRYIFNDSSNPNWLVGGGGASGGGYSSGTPIYRNGGIGGTPGGGNGGKYGSGADEILPGNGVNGKGGGGGGASRYQAGGNGGNGLIVIRNHRS